MMGVRVSGRGIAAASAAHCLAARGIAVDAQTPDLAGARQAPVVMLGEQAQVLLADVFAGNAALGDVLQRAHRINRRVVRWGEDEPQAFGHAGRVIAGDLLGEALPWPAAPEVPPPIGFALSTMPPAGARLLHFGAREAVAVPVVLTAAADRGAALVEALDHGWLFLIPTGGDAGWLLAVGAEPDQALRDSRLVAPAVAATGAVSSCFETAPGMLDHPAAPGLLTVGSGALAFDPICGDGVATAVRGGILAAAVGAAMTGADLPALDPWLDGEALTGHYRAMMIAAMRRHLTVSWPFYARGGRSPWWQAQGTALAEGHAWCTRQLAEAGEARFMLSGDRLISRDVAA
jgi:hypothetical protein